MAVYRGLVLRDAFARVSDPNVRIAVVTNVNIRLEFPQDVRLAYVQATNWFPGDRITFQAFTVYTNDQRPNTLTFERLRNDAGDQSVGFFSFLVETADSDSAKGYREG